MLEKGNPMPDFSAQDQNGNIISSRDLIGKKTVVYFYPKANTPGCTAEACSLRDNYEKFLALGYNVIGISILPKSFGMLSEPKSIASLRIAVRFKSRNYTNFTQLKFASCQAC